VLVRAEPHVSRRGYSSDDGCCCPLLCSSSRLLKEYKEILKARNVPTTMKQEIALFPPDESNLHLWHAYSPSSHASSHRAHRSCSCCCQLCSLACSFCRSVAARQSLVRPTRRMRIISSPSNFKSRSNIHSHHRRSSSSLRSVIRMCISRYVWTQRDRVVE
jgi:hypothetical protein